MKENHHEGGIGEWRAALQLESNREKILAFAIANHFILLYNVNMIDTAAEEKLKQLHSKPRQLDLIMDTLGGRLLHGRLVFQQHFLIRSNELDPDGKVSIVAVVNLLQESALNHLRSVGLLADGFGSTPEMHRRDLIWVAYRLQIEVEHKESIFRKEVGAEIKPYVMNCDPLINQDKKKLLHCDFDTADTSKQVLSKVSKG
ncbi:palmitoyl-acyl carrier protein thioesterase [Quercus suber]|uniref:Acyl-[acyl-carrier-protein] hydrolase n=1 Tax=Quercus suber TaxID=58331 RepID=A0AAW0LQX6_QUESU